MEPRGIRNNNPLNIRKGSNWKGERPVQTDKSFEEFETMEMGIRAGFKLLKNYVTGYGGKVKPYDTIDKIIRRWAPPTENATEKYIQFVSDDAGLHRYKKIEWRNKSAMVRIVNAMIFVECGQRVDMNIISSAYDLL